MIKRLSITILLAFSYLTASAQIATPLLDRNMKVQSPAAAGWRDSSTVGINAVSAEGKVEIASSEVGDATVGGDIPAVLAVFKGEELAVELFMSTDTTKTADLNFYGSTLIGATTVVYAVDLESEDKLPETRLNLSYVFGEALSVGLGYRTEDTKSESTSIATSTNALYSAFIDGTTITEGKETETGLMVSASMKLGEMFYVAAGMENVNYTSDDTVDNAWSNTIVGLGLLVGDSGESRFRVEYSIIQSPESEEAATSSKSIASHPKTDYNTMSLEALFGNFLLSYISETKKETDAVSAILGTVDTKLVTTQMGLGWMPEEGLSVSAYVFNLSQTDTSATSELTSEPSGYRVNVGWNF